MPHQPSNNSRSQRSSPAPVEDNYVGDLVSRALTSKRDRVIEGRIVRPSHSVPVPGSQRSFLGYVHNLLLAPLGSIKVVMVAFMWLLAVLYCVDIEDDIVTTCKLVVSSYSLSSRRSKLVRNTATAAQHQPHAAGLEDPPGDDTGARRSYGRIGAIRTACENPTPA